MQQRWRTSLIWAWTAAVVVFLYLPALCLLLASLTASRYFIFPITRWGLDWWQKTFASLEVHALFETSISIALCVTVIAVTIGVNVYLFTKVPAGFFPEQDTGRMQGNVTGQQHISFRALRDKTLYFEKIVRADPDVDTIDVFAGSGSRGSSVVPSTPTTLATLRSFIAAARRVSISGWMSSP